MKRIIAASIIAGLLLAPFGPGVRAHDEDSTVNDPSRLEQANETGGATEAEQKDRQEKFELRKEQLRLALEQREKQLTDRRAKRCEFIKSKLQFHRDKAAEIRSHRAKRYQHIIDRLDALADRLDAHDIDSTGLRDAIQRLTTIVGTYESTFTNYEVELQEAIVKACDDGEFSREEVKALRELLVRLRSNAETVHTFIREELKPALAAIKGEVKEAREAAGESREGQTEVKENIDHAPPPPASPA